MYNKITKKKYIIYRILLYSVLVLALLLICKKLFTIEEMTISQLDRIICKSRSPKLNTERQCPSNGIITVVQGGRLANQIWEYASVWAAARETGLEPYVPSCTRKKLKRIFANLSIPSLSLVKRCSLPRKKIIKDRNIHRDNRTELTDLLKRYANTTNTVVLPIYVTLETEVFKYLDEIKSEFRIRTSLRRKSRIALVEATEGYRLPVTYVCVHVRRTDYADYLQRFGYLLAGASFFYNAMAYFESVYDNIAFIVVSDDPDWCRENLLIGRTNVHIISDESGSPELDMAVMAACDHSIIDYGTYGVWGAIFAGGETVVYNITHKSTINVVKLMPNWKFMD